jgi:GH24 family phage-related lysozyme (muramidase)
MKTPSDDTLKLLLEYEVGGGKSYYDKYLSKFTFPGGESGPTIGIGIDCAFYSKEEISKIFSFLNDEDIKLIQGASGKTGQAGKEYTKVLRNAGITVSWDQAMNIFESLTWKKFSTLAEKTFPDLDKLCDNAYGAIVSLVFNRGTSLKGNNRIEMQNLKNIIPTKDYGKIANEFVKMKRIWQGKGLDGLLKRRDAEADLVRSCI